MKITVDYSKGFSLNWGDHEATDALKDSVFFAITETQEGKEKQNLKKIDTFLAMCDAANCMMKICGGKIEIHIHDQGHVGQIICWCKSIHTFGRKDDSTSAAITLLIRDCDSMDFVVEKDFLKLIFWLKM